MKSAAFDYIRPETLDAACACLSSHPDARIIAGGQSLVPMLAMRLARPSMVIDIAHIDGLSTIQETTNTVVLEFVFTNIYAGTWNFHILYNQINNHNIDKLHPIK